MGETSGAIWGSFGGVSNQDAIDYNTIGALGGSIGQIRTKARIRLQRKIEEEYRVDRAAADAKYGEKSPITKALVDDEMTQAERDEMRRLEEAREALRRGIADRKALGSE